jgi:outer membrane lipoprotein-sorting protein
MNLHKQANILFAVVVTTLCFGVMPAISHAELSAAEIVRKSSEIHGGNASISTLTFTFQEPNVRERELAYTMLWKDYKGQDGITTKMIFFKEYPPADKGIAYMIWMYSPALNQDDDEWLYLPELRTVRKLSKKIGTDTGEHNQKDEDNEFSKSLLHRQQLVPRPAELDTCELVRTDEIDGKEYYVIERTPKKNDSGYPYRKTINWISKDNFLLTKIDYIDRAGIATLRQQIKWQKIDNAWVWAEVRATSNATGNTTVLKVSDVRINPELDDDAFTKRVMKLGIDSLRLEK